MIQTFLVIESNGHDSWVALVRSKREDAHSYAHILRNKKKHNTFTVEEWFIDDPEDVKRLGI